MSDSELNWLYKTAKEMQSIVEVGCWRGRSTYALCSGCPGWVYAVDHFKGSSEHQDIIKTGFDVREDFLKNMKDLKRWVLFEMDSLKAVEVFSDRSIDMVFLDASHEFDHFLDDLGAWAPKAKKMICGHDFDYPAIRLALDHYFGDDTFQIHDRIWIREV
jgi:hypothetical protein